MHRRGGEIGFAIEHYMIGAGATFVPPTHSMGGLNWIERFVYWWKVGAHYLVPRVNVQLGTAAMPESAPLAVGLKHELDHFEDYLKMKRGEPSPHYGVVRSPRANLPKELGVSKDLVHWIQNYWHLLLFDENFTMPRNLYHLASSIDNPIAPINLFTTPQTMAEIICTFGRTGLGINSTTRRLVDYLIRSETIDSLTFKKNDGIIWATARFFIDPKNFRTATEFKVPLVDAKELNDKKALSEMYIQQVKSILPILDQTEVLLQWASEYENVFGDPKYAHIDRKTLSKAFIKVVLAPQFGMHTGQFQFTREALDEEFARSLAMHSELPQ